VKELLTAAQQLYESRDLKHAPPWSQLGDVTRSVWVDKIKAGEKPPAPKKGKK
jgi:hypothetical protein